MDNFNLIITTCETKQPLISLESTKKGKKKIYEMVMKMTDEELEQALKDLQTYERRKTKWQEQ